MSFSAQVAGFGKAASQRVQNVRKGVTIKLLGAVVLDTPVDTGRARANWNISQDQPDRTVNEDTDKGGVTVLNKITAEVQKTSGDTPVFLTNNLPYIGGLENGNSKQAPQGMVRRNIVRFARLIKIQVAETKK